MQVGKKRFGKGGLTFKTAVVAILVSIVTVGLISGVSYRNFKMAAVENSIRQVETAMDQVSGKLDDEISKIYDIYAEIELNASFKTIAAKDSHAFDLTDFNTIAGLFNSTRATYSKIIDSFIFIRNDGQIFCELQNVMNRNADYKNTEWYQLAKKNRIFAIWYPPYRNELFVNNHKESLGFMKFTTSKFGEETGLLIMNINLNYFQTELDNLNLGNGVRKFVLDEENRILVAGDNLQKECAEFLEAAGAEENTHSKLTYNGKKCYLLKVKVEITGWDIIAVIEETELAGRIGIVKNGIATAVFTGIIVAAALMVLVLMNITIPLTRLSNAMRKTGNHKRSLYEGAEIERNDEIGYLARSYNVMLKDIDLLTRQIRIKSEEESKAQLRALQQQINSHFLYNTLDSIYWKVACEDKAGSMDMIKRLSTYFRLALNKGDDITTVEKEIQHIENYIGIEKYRYKNKISCLIDVEQELYAFRLPKLLLQPLVENAIVHGVFTKDHDAFVRVCGKREGENIVFSVEDNGVGMDVSAVTSYVKNNEKTENLKSSFALRNIYTRIKIYYKGRGDIEFYTNQYQGAGIRITLPAGEMSMQDEAGGEDEE